MKLAGTQHIFFDLDHTLWDFDRNSTETMLELLQRYAARMSKPVDADAFVALYHQHNHRLWKRYREDKIDFEMLRRIRWHITFRELEVEIEDWVDQMGEEYLLLGPRKTHLMPNAIEVLEALSSRFSLHIISNGFSNVQAVKMQSSGLDRFFGEVVCPDNAGVKKPHPAIFRHALTATGADPARSVHIGDSYEADVLGAMGAGIPVVYFNPTGEQNPDGVTEVKDLKELLALLG